MLSRAKTYDPMYLVILNPTKKQVIRSIGKIQ